MVGMTTTRRNDTASAGSGDRDETGRPGLDAERRAFQALLGPHHAAALALATRILGSHEDAEDAVQDVLIKTWSTRESLGQVQDMRAWFLRVVFNRCLDVRRRRSTRAGYERRAPVSQVPSPAEASARRDVLRRVREVMGELPPKQQAVLHLRVFEEMEYAAIGAVLDLTPHSARVYLVKARAYLRGRLGRELEDS